MNLEKCPTKGCAWRLFRWRSIAASDPRTITEAGFASCSANMLPALLSLENFYGFPPARYGNRPPSTLQMETAGPLHTIVKAEGEYEPLSGAEGSFTDILRFHFYAGRTERGQRGRP